MLKPDGTRSVARFALGLAELLYEMPKMCKPATFHITDIIEKGKHREYHFCDEHARQLVAPPKNRSSRPRSAI